MARSGGEVNPFAHSTWWGSRYAMRGRSVTMREPAWIFTCPACEYAMTALGREGIDTLRRTHVRTCHPHLILDLAALDTIDAAPRHLRL